MKVFNSKKATMTTYGPILAILVGFAVNFALNQGWITADMANLLVASFTALTGLTVTSYNIGQGKVDAAKEAAKAEVVTDTYDDDFDLPEN